MTKDRIWTLASRKLSGEATDSELAELTDLIKSAANADLYMQAIQEYWKTFPEADQDFLEATYHLHLNRLKDKGFDFETDKDKEEHDAVYFENVSYKKPSTNKWWVYSVAVLSVLGVLFMMLYKYENKAINIASEKKPAKSEVSTKSGSRSMIQLPDGSSVWLNGSSKLVYDNQNFGDKIREVTLTGEAYFDVVKNPEKPFIIHTAKMDIKVLGTAFNVKAYAGEKNTETSLIRGSIEVTLKGRQEKIMMKPNDKLIIQNDEVEPIKESAAVKTTGRTPHDSYISLSHLTLSADKNTILETAWVENKLVFDNETFEDVVNKMERWYGVQIRFADDNLKLERLTGNFEKETVEEALSALEISTPVFKHKINNQIIYILKLK
ncbi:MAG: FecR family protein [Ferruginibacter sp.]